MHPSSFEWNDAVWILIFVVVVALFLGPGMWSSSTNTLAKDLWLKWRARRRPAPSTPQREAVPREKEGSSGVSPSPPDPRAPGA